jgi:hypothetical protein
MPCTSQGSSPRERAFRAISFANRLDGGTEQKARHEVRTLTGPDQAQGEPMNRINPRSGVVDDSGVDEVCVVCGKSATGVVVVTRGSSGWETSHGDCVIPAAA